MCEKFLCGIVKKISLYHTNVFLDLAKGITIHFFDTLEFSFVQYCTLRFMALSHL